MSNKKPITEEQKADMMLRMWKFYRGNFGQWNRWISYQKWLWAQGKGKRVVII